jgi:2,4-dichlorophenol 6-monooxygenase
VTPTHVPVLIVGGGVAGLTASLLLARLGVEHLLIERHRQTALLPKAHIVNQRTMEIFRQIGIDDEVYAAGAPADNMSTIAWTTSLTGPTSLHGRTIARTPAWSGGPDYVAASPCRATNLPQLRLEPILQRNAEQDSSESILFDHELTGFESDEFGVRADVKNRETGATVQITADYLIAADGGRTVGPQLGVNMLGESNLLDMLSTHFGADLSEHWKDESVAIAFSVNPDGEGSLGSGVLLPMGPVWGARSEEWQYHSALNVGDPDEFTDEMMATRVRDRLGLPDLQPEIFSVSRWRFEALVADRYRVGRVFLVGDAAHRHPPNGGLGLNTGIGDVYNLTWKLALTLRGIGSDELLDSYEAERRPVGERVVRRAVRNWQAQPAIDRALGIDDDTPASEAWESLAEYFDPESAGGEERREAVVAAVANASIEFIGQDVELGYRYVSPVIQGGVADDAPQPEGHYSPSTSPGRTVPHAWLRSATSGATRSTIDLAGSDSFALLVDPKFADSWRVAVENLPVGIWPSLTVSSIGSEGSGADWIDIDDVWNSRRGVQPRQALLIRPDKHIAWRLDADDADPTSALTHALTTAIGTTQQKVRQ